MVAIKRFFDGRFETFVFRVRDQHAHPGDRLKNGPMAADGKNQQKRNKDVNHTLAHLVERVGGDWILSTEDGNRSGREIR